MNKELPARANLEHLKSQAKDLLAALKRGDASARERFRTHLPAARGKSDDELSALPLALHDAQSVIAREYGFASFAELKADVERRTLSPEALRALMEKNKSEPPPEVVVEAIRKAALEAQGATPFAPIASGSVLPVVPVRNAVVTVGSIAPLGIGRPASVAAVRASERSDGVIALFTQREETTEAPSDTQLHPVGCAARIVKTFDVPDRGYWILVRAMEWIALDALEQTTPYIAARVAPFEIATAATDEVKALETKLRELVRATVAAMPDAETLLRMTERMSPLELADATVANLPASVDEKARYAAEAELATRLELALELFRKAG
jgi:Lon protease-like protein